MNSTVKNMLRSIELNAFLTSIFKQTSAEELFLNKNHLTECTIVLH